MAYLTFEEYKAMPYKTVSEEEFPDLLETASDVIDPETSFFYRFNSLDEDVVNFRREQFKKAIGCQIGFMAESGSMTTQGLNTPNSFSIGRTTISKGSTANSTGSDGKPNLLSDDAISLLTHTGLLYRGIGGIR